MSPRKGETGTDGENMNWKDAELNSWREYLSQEPSPGPLWYRVGNDFLEVFWSLQEEEGYPSGALYWEDGSKDLLFTVSSDLKPLEA